MSAETALAQRDTSIPRKVSLRGELNREDSGYLSVIGTPAGTPSVMSRRQSRADQPQTLKGIPENCSEQEGTPSSSPAPSFFTNGATRQLQEQLSVPDDERSSHSAPNACGNLRVPSFNRTISLDIDNYYVTYTDGNCYKRIVSKKAEQIISRFEKLRTDSDESVATQLPSPVDESFEQPGEEDIVQYRVPDVSPPMAQSMLQRQFSEFPLDESVLTLGQDGYYLEDRDYNIVRTAGAGGSASCNLGNDNAKCSQFIIKRPKKSYSEEEKQDVMRESRILQQIDHDNVIRFYGLVEDLQDHCFKIFLEYAEETCGDIHHVFCDSEDKDSFSGNIALIMLYVQQMLYAVDYLHRETGILHLDIKGKNIVVCNGGYRVKLIDFGTACQASGAQPQKYGWTPVFAAPEVNNQKCPPKFSADIWSVMCVAVEMVTGALPWPKVTSEHEAAMFKVGFYEDNQITELVEYDSSEYWDKYSYYDTHHDMYQELVNMWKMVFRKESSSRPSAHYLLNMKWMREMEIRGESILYELVSGEEQEQPCVEESCSVENENNGIPINHPPIDSSQGYNEDNLSDHNFSRPGRSSPYHLQPYTLSGGHSPVGSDSDTYFDCNSSFSGRSDGYLPDARFFPSAPSSLPVPGTYLNPNGFNYQNTSTPMTSSGLPQFAVNGSRDFTDGRDNDLSSSGRARSHSYSMQRKPSDIEQVTGKRRKSLCHIGSSKSEPINVLNASSIMDSINKANVKRVNSLTYVMEGPKTDSPVSSPKPVEEQSLVPGTVSGITPQQPRRSSSDVGTPTSSSVMDSGYGDSLKERLSIKRSTSVDQTTLQSSSRLSLPDRDEHKPDGCSEPSETIPHTLQLSSSATNKTQHIEVNGSTTVKEIMKMTQNTTSGDSIVIKLQ